MKIYELQLMFVGEGPAKARPNEQATLRRFFGNTKIEAINEARRRCKRIADISGQTHMAISQLDVRGYQPEMIERDLGRAKYARPRITWDSNGYTTVHSMGSIDSLMAIERYLLDKALDWSGDHNSKVFAKEFPNQV